MDNRRFDHAMLVGPPGCGKTSVSHIVAQEMAAPLIEVLGQSVSNLAELNALLLSAKEDKTIVFVDEAAELDRTLQVALYMAMDQRKIVVNGKTGGSPITIPLADITLLLATTHEADLLQPLRDRMRLVLRFRFYSTEELAELVRCVPSGCVGQWMARYFPRLPSGLAVPRDLRCGCCSPVGGCVGR